MRQPDGQLPVQERRHLYEHLLLGGEAALLGQTHLPRQEVSPPGVDQGLEAYPATRAGRPRPAEVGTHSSGGIYMKLINQDYGVGTPHGKMKTRD